MAYVKKISDMEFVKDNVTFMLRNYGIDADYILSLPKKPEDESLVDPNVEYQDDWFLRYKFKSIDEHRAWRKFFYERYKDWQPRYHWKKYYVYREFEYFNLNWGLATDYEYTNEEYQQIAEDVYKEVFGESKTKKQPKQK